MKSKTRDAAEKSSGGLDRRDRFSGKEQLQQGKNPVFATTQVKKNRYFSCFH